MKDERGEIHDVPSHCWQSVEFKFFLVTGLANWQPEDRVYQGQMLVGKAELKQFKTEQAKKNLAQEENVARVPGRPTLMPEIEEEMRRRFQTGEIQSSMYKEARHLDHWGKETFPHKDGLIPKAKSIENTLGKLYKELKEQSHPGTNPKTP